MKRNENEKNAVNAAFDRLAHIIKKAIAVRNTTQNDLAKIDKSDGLTDAYKAELKRPVQAAHDQVWGELWEEYGEDVESLGKALAAWHGGLALDDPALANALKMIELGGSNLSTETILAINGQFVGQQPMLRALQSVYKAKGVVYDGGLDKQIYDLEPALESLNEWGYATFYRDGTLNSLANAVAKLARMEGVDFNPTPDEAGFIETIRKGAGLTGGEA